MRISILTIISILLLVFWCVQFLKLMRMQTEDFSSREDKAIWAVVMIFLNVFGSLLFWIHFQSKHEVIPQLGTDLYEKIKDSFPDHQVEIDLALKMSPYKRYDLEKYYSKKSPSALVSQFKNGSKDIDPCCYGVLLAVLTSKSIEISHS